MLAAGVAHEIRNPLTAIKARLFTQQKALTPGSRGRADAEFIGREIDRLEKIVSAFLRFARPVEPDRVPLSPANLLHEVRQLMAPQLRASSIDLTVERVVETKVLADPGAAQTGADKSRAERRGGAQHRAERSSCARFESRIALGGNKCAKSSSSKSRIMAPGIPPTRAGYRCRCPRLR